MISAEEIIKLIEQGTPLKEISKLVGENYYKLREQGNNMEQAKRIINELIYELLINGSTQEEISKVVNVTEETIKKRLRVLCEEKGQDYIEIKRKNDIRKKEKLKQQCKPEISHATKIIMTSEMKRELKEKRKEWKRYLKEEYLKQNSSESDSLEKDER